MDGGNYLKLKIALIIVGLLSGSVFTYAQVDNSIESSILNAYEAIDEADNSGGDVSELVDSLNQLIDSWTIRSITFQEANSILDSIIENAERIKQQGIEEQNYRFGFVAINSVVVLGLCLIIWRYFPRLFWGIWLRYRGHWLVE
jgi:hypothetical protein